MYTPPWFRSPGTGKVVYQQGNMIDDLPTSSLIISGARSEVTEISLTTVVLIIAVIYAHVTGSAPSGV